MYNIKRSYSPEFIFLPFVALLASHDSTDPLTVAVILS